jgi:hypothetical protein
MATDYCSEGHHLVQPPSAHRICEEQKQPRSFTGRAKGAVQPRIDLVIHPLSAAAVVLDQEACNAVGLDHALDLLGKMGAGFKALS